MEAAMKIISIEGYEELKTKLIVRLINAGRNKELLEHAAHKKILDLALIACIPISETKAVAISESLMDELEISGEELIRDALENTAAVRPKTIKTLTDQMLEIEPDLADEFGSIPRDEDDMIVVTNQMIRYGAAALMYPGTLEEVSEMVGGDYYILPSSVHEVIILKPELAPDVAELNAMICSINQVEVMDEDQLADHAYYYSSRTKRLSIV